MINVEKNIRRGAALWSAYLSAPTGDDAQQHAEWAVWRNANPDVANVVKWSVCAARDYLSDKVVR